MLAYLGAYTHRIAISNPRILRLENGRVDFRYRDYADDRKPKIMRLAVDEFIRRFLLHVLPEGLRPDRVFFAERRSVPSVVSLPPSRSGSRSSPGFRGEMNASTEPKEDRP